MLIYVCISGHGFGHGSRVASVLSALHRLQPSWRIVLSTPLPARFLDLAFEEIPFEHRPLRWDVGVIQADALGADPDATLAALEALDERLPQQIQQELAWLREQAEPVVLLADVPPDAARLARALAAPLIWMGNFGWDAIYRPMGGSFTALAERALGLYRQGTALIRCPLAMEMDWGLPSHDVGLTAGRPRLDSAAVRDRLNLRAAPDRTVLMGFGGLGLQLNPGLFARWPDHHFLVSDPGLHCAAKNVSVLPQDLRPLEVMPLCSRVITKPGYSTFCEAMALGLGIHLVHREGFAEAQVLEEALQRHAPHRLLSRAQLEKGEWQLDQPLIPASGSGLPPDGADQAARILIALASDLRC